MEIYISGNIFFLDVVTKFSLGIRGAYQRNYDGILRPIRSQTDRCLGPKASLMPYFRVLQWLIDVSQDWVFPIKYNSAAKEPYSFVRPLLFTYLSTESKQNLSLAFCLSFVFPGSQCELQDHCASSPCRNGAVCTSLEDTYECDCAPGFVGQTCSEDIIECVDDPCVHGECFNTHGSYT